MEVTAQQTAHAAMVPSMGGIGGYVHQDAVTVITTHTGARLVIEGTSVRLGGVDITGETAPEARTHGETVAFWQGQATRWAADAAHLEDAPEVIEVGAFEVEGQHVDAPGFEREQFIAFVDRAKASQLRTTPAGQPGTVMVQSGSSPAQYAVTRTDCSCQGHRGHGRCYHRALVIHLADVEGVDVCTVPTIGANARGRALTYGRRIAAAVAS